MYRSKKGKLAAVAVAGLIAQACGGDAGPAPVKLDAGPRDAPGGSGGNGGGGGALDAGPDRLVSWEGGGESCGMMTTALPLNPRFSDVLIVFDRSGSMRAPFGSGTRYSVEEQLLNDAVTSQQDRVRFGFQQFPSHQTYSTCPPSYDIMCCADRPSVPVGMDNAGPIATAIRLAGPVEGNTPTAEALRYAREYFGTLVDGVTDRFVLLSTDGTPTCDINGKHSMDLESGGALVSGPCFDAIEQVKALAIMNVKVVVVGVGAEVGSGVMGLPPCIEEMARRGGAPRPGGNPSYYSAENPGELQRALAEVIGGIARPSCTVNLKEYPPDRSKVAVFFDDQQVPWDPTHRDGWDYFPSTGIENIRIYGSWCMKLQSFTVKNLDVRFGCPPCGGTVSCP